MEESAKEFPGVGKHEEVGDLLEHMEEEEEDDGNPSLFRRDTDVGFRGSFPSMAAMAEWPKLERDDPLVWPDAWKRPEIPEPLDKYFDLHSHIYGGREEAFPETENPDFGIAFQMVDITYSMYTISDEREIKKPHVDDPYGADLETFPPTYSRLVVDVRKEPEIRMFGTNAAGNSVCMRYRGFLPYLYIRMDPASSTIPEDYWDGEESKDKRAHVEQCVHARLQRYMCLPKENQERLRMASMHIDPFRALTERLCEEFSTLMEEISGDGGGMMAEEEEDQEVSEWLEFLSSYIESFREFHQDVISHQAIGDRSSSCCPHWVRACEARARAIERKNTSPGVSGIMMEGFFLGWFDPGTPECKIRCKMCHEMIELFDMIVKMARKTNGILMGQEGEEDPLKYYVRDAKMCIDRFCTILVDDVVEPVIAFEREDDMQSTPKEETHDFEYISNVRFEDCHQSMMACEEKDKARKAPFLRIELYNPRDCTDVRTASQYAGLLIHIPTFMPRRTHDRSEPFTSWIVTYESNIPFVLRFTADHDISGMGWVYSGPRAWTPVPVWDPDRKSKCQIEVYIDGWSLPMDMPLSEIVSGKPEWQQMAPLVWMFFDDEMAGQNPNRMPRPNNIGDLLSQSGVVIYRQNEKEPFEACVFSLGGSEPLLRRVNRREHISPEERDLYSRAKTYTFGSECDLMLAWRRMVEIVCPDFLCGYNSVDFDLPYMVRRSTTGVAVGRDTHVAFRRLSKVIEHEYASKGEDGGTYWRGLTDIRKERFQSKAFGLRENDKATTTGITQFDTLRVVKQNEKKRSYKLDKVARETLNMHKVPLPHTEITPKATSPYDVMRSLLDRYCLWDSILPKLIAVDNKTYDIIYTEMARITGVTMDHLLGKGQRVKITQRLLKTARRARMDDQGISRKICPSPGGSPYSTQDPISFLIPYQRDCPMNVNPSHYDTDDILEGEDDDDDHMTRGAKYSGATVLKARRGYYKEPTPTLDFSSLYPSIMQANNYCVTTYLGTREQAEALGLVCAWDFRKEKDYRWTPFDKMPDGDFVVAPNNAAFVTRKHRVGLMCVDLGEILAARSRRKKLMGQYDKGSTERSAHNGAQLGLKVTANSMYGYTAGCNTAVSEAVTSTGRFLLKFTRDLVYERGQREPRYENEQLYGDTDSIMFRLFNVPKLLGAEADRYDLHEAARIGVELAKWITSIYQTFGLFSIVLEFEKVYETWVLKSKKCYAVYKHLFDVKTGKLTASLSSSGMASVRRDVTLFTQRLLERVIEMTVKERDLDGAIRFVQKMFTELKEGRVPIDQLIITGGFSKRADQYKGHVPHIEAVRKQMEVDPNNAPTVGSRIDWVIACLSDDPRENAKAKVYEKAVMPEYLKEHNMRLDYEGYITKCAKPFCMFFAPALAPNMNATQGQAYVMRTVFQDYFRERDEIEKRRNSALINAFARSIVVDEEGKKTEPKANGKRGTEEALLRVDPSRAQFYKKRRANPDQIRKEKSAFSTEALTTTAETLDDWMFATGTTKKGTRLLEKKGK